MTRHGGILLCILFPAWLAACGKRESPPAARPKEMAAPAPAPAAAPEAKQTAQTDAEWRKKLTPEEYRIMRQKGTERAFSGNYWKTKTPGLYACAACGLHLYSSKAKFDSGTGWPSFWAPLQEKAVATEPDSSHGMVRVELLCSGCGAHLGHLFDDGPQPTGMRHCINSASLRLIETKE